MTFKDLPITVEEKRFKEHLEIEENNRIIFSGIFGIGKTYFLNKFFELNSDKFIAIKLAPVNYSVSQNEDIFELIKFDIGFELFSKIPNFENTEFSNMSIAETYVLENYKAIIKDFIKNLSKIDRRLDAILTPILNLKEQIEKFKGEVQVNQRNQLFEFLNSTKDSKGLPIEENNITDLINSLIESLK